MGTTAIAMNVDCTGKAVYRMISTAARIRTVLPSSRVPRYLKVPLGITSAILKDRAAPLKIVSAANSVSRAIAATAFRSAKTAGVTGMSWIAQATILRVHNAIIEVGLKRDTLLSGIAPGIIGALKIAAAPNEQLLQDLTRLRMMKQSEPLRILLTNAYHLSQQQESPAAMIFEAALAELASHTLGSETFHRQSVLAYGRRLPIGVWVAGGLIFGVILLGLTGYRLLINGNGASSQAELLMPRLSITAAPPSSGSVGGPVASARSTTEVGTAPPAKKVSVLISAFAGTFITLSGGPTKVSGKVKDSGSMSTHDAASFQVLPGEYTITCKDDTGEIITRHLSVRSEASNVISASCIGR